MSSSEIRASSLEQHADALWQAAASRTPIEPLTASDPSLDSDRAYEVQRLVAERRRARGAGSAGRKIGLTSAAMQRQLGVNEPDYGRIFDEMLVEDGEEIDRSSLLQPRLEGEIAFQLATDLAGPGVRTADVLEATAGVCAAIEVIDSRIADWRITLADTIADNASSGLVVLAGHFVPPRSVDLRLAGMALYRDGELVATGAGAAVLGNPARCVAWLANKLAGFGESLHAGEIVLAGALHGAVDAPPGSSFRAEFSGLGAVTTRFSGARP
jgi:2-keto-4-pentenoate hydratase